MDYRPFKRLPSTYQLHYHFCFQTKFDRAVFASWEHEEFLAEALRSICERNHYHLLDHKSELDKLFCLLSLRPEYNISDVARIVKTNLAREFNQRFAELATTFKDRALWSIGYYVGSVGKASKKVARQYIDHQGQHHGVPDKESIEVMR